MKTKCFSLPLLSPFLLGSHSPKIEQIRRAVTLQPAKWSLMFCILVAPVISASVKALFKLLTAKIAIFRLGVNIFWSKRARWLAYRQGGASSSTRQFWKLERWLFGRFSLSFLLIGSDALIRVSKNIFERRWLWTRSKPVNVVASACLRLEGQGWPCQYAADTAAAGLRCFNLHNQQHAV